MSATITANPIGYQPGDLLTVAWSLRLRDCPGPVYYIVGPGFGGPIPTSGSIVVKAVGEEMDWSLYLYDIYTDMPIPIEMAHAHAFWRRPL